MAYPTMTDVQLVVPSKTTIKWPVSEKTAIAFYRRRLARRTGRAVRTRHGIVPAAGLAGRRWRRPAGRLARRWCRNRTWRESRRAILRDPLLLQVLPRREESESPSGFSADPLGEATVCRWSPAMLWKYPGRSLIVATGDVRRPLPVLFSSSFSAHPSPSRRAKLAGLERGPGANRPPKGRSTRSILSGGDPLTVGPMTRLRRT